MKDTEDLELAGRYDSLRWPTLGGKQFWTDQLWRQGWRIQKHVDSGSCRLIDPYNLRHASGTFEDCKKILTDHVPDDALPSGKAIILIHGLLRSSSSMRPIARALKKKIKCEIVYFEYASTRAAIPDHGRALKGVLEALPASVELSIVAHSLGGILTRYMLGEWQREGCQAMLDRVDSVVMLGTPNQGAKLADKLSRMGIFEIVTGASGMQLGPHWRSIEDSLAIPSCPFGIIAGRIENRLMKNPWLGPNSDFVVSVDETKLAGATDFMEVDKLHTLLMNDPRVQQAVVNFVLKHRFSDEGSSGQIRV
jgi:pimeloyl-ACP methyl ester carboxylesterase